MRKSTTGGAKSTLLTPLEIGAAQPRASAYRLNAGGSLFVVVRPSGAKSFEFRYKRGGKIQALILGAYGTERGKMGLRVARLERDRLKALIAAGKDPAAQRQLAAEAERGALAEADVAEAARKAAAAQAKAEAAQTALTLKVVAEAWIADSRVAWTPKHVDQVLQSLRDHVYPTIGDRPIGDIEPANILDLLGGLLADGKVETARRVRQRLDAVFEYAAGRRPAEVRCVDASCRSWPRSVRQHPTLRGRPGV